MDIYLCDDTIDGIFSAIYEAWAAGTSHTDVRVRQTESMSLFEEYIDTMAKPELAVKVQRSILNKLSDDVYSAVYYAALSDEANKASIIYHFLQKAFRIGPSILNQLNDKDVLSLFSCSRAVSRESCHYLGFVRFNELANGVLSGFINPKANIVPLIADHFADRLHNENWILLDTNRNLAAIHPCEKHIIFHEGITEEELRQIPYSEKEENFHALWNRFFDTIAIKERTNPVLQRNLMPLRFRKYMQ